MPRSWSYRKMPKGYKPPVQKGMPPAVIGFILLSIFSLGVTIGGAIILIHHPYQEVDGNNKVVRQTGADPIDVH